MCILLGWREERRLVGWACGVGRVGTGRGARQGLSWGQSLGNANFSRASEEVVPATVVLVSTFTVSCGEVWSCSSVAALLALSPTHGSLSSEQENETGSPEWFMGGVVFWGCDTAICVIGSGHLFPGRCILLPWVFPTRDPQIVTRFILVAC